MTKEIMKVSKQELEAVDEHAKKLEQQNYKLVALRKKQIYIALREATMQRINTSKQISDWIKMLANKIFNPETIEEMDLNKAIALFKYVNNINLKVLAESNRLEEILSKYLESGVMDTADKVNRPNTPTNEREKIKHEILSKLNKMFKETSDEAEVVEIKPVEGLSPEEEAELENAEKALEENLAAIDEDIELDINSNLDDES
jgi:hypothetical protein